MCACAGVRAGCAQAKEGAEGAEVEHRRVDARHLLSQPRRALAQEVGQQVEIPFSEVRCEERCIEIGAIERRLGAHEFGPELVLECVVRRVGRHVLALRVRLGRAREMVVRDR